MYSGGWADNQYDYMKFDLTNAPPVASTTDASLWTYAITVGGVDPVLNVYYETSAWDRLTLTRALHPTATYWGPGPTGWATANTWYSSSITSLYDNWKNGSITNYGLNYQPNSTPSGPANDNLVTSDDPNPMYHPKLVITTNPGTAPVRADSIVPYSAANNASVAITSIAGNNFASGATVSLQMASTTISCTGFTFVSSTSLTNGTCPITGAATGIWNLVVTNTDGSNGTLAPAFQIFTAIVPTVVTSAATSITSSAATLNGAGNPNLATATGWFRYSMTTPGTCNDTFGTRVPASGGTALGAGSSAVPFSQTISSLSSGTTYYYCAIASNYVGTGFGSVMSFNTAALTVPTVTTPTGTATDITARIGANVTSDGGAGILIARGTCWGTSPAPTTNCLAEGGTTTGTFVQGRTGLPPSTLIYYRGYAINIVGTAYSSDASFTTGANPGVTATVTGGTTTNVGGRIIRLSQPAELLRSRG